MRPTNYLMFKDGKLHQLWVSDDRRHEEWRKVGEADPR